MSTEDVISGLSAANEKAAHVNAKLLAAIKDTDEMAALVAAALRGSQAGPLLQLVRQAKQAITQAGAQLPALQARIDDTIRRTQALGN